MVGSVGEHCNPFPGGSQSGGVLTPQTCGHVQPQPTVSVRGQAVEKCWS
jgi:hypothetical protein